MLARRTGPAHEVRITRAGYQVIERLAIAGLSDAAIAASLRVSPKTWRALVDRDDRVREAIATGRATLETELVGELLARAKAGGTAELIFATKALLGFRDQGPPPDRVAAGPVTISISLPPAMSRDEYLRSLAIDTTATDVSGAPDDSVRVAGHLPTTEEDTDG
jgi:hypothetical protein